MSALEVALEGSLLTGSETQENYEKERRDIAGGMSPPDPSSLSPLVCGLALATMVLTLISGPHLRASGFGLVPNNGGSEESEFVQRTLRRHCDRFVCVYVLGSMVRFVEVFSGQVPAPFVPRIVDGDTSLGGWPALLGFLATFPPPLTYCLLSVVYFRCAAPQKVGYLRMVLRFVPLLGFFRIVFCMWRGVPLFMNEKTLFLRHQNVYWGLMWFNTASILYLASSLDVPFIDVMTNMAFLGSRQLGIMGKYAVVAPTLAVLGAIASVMVLKPGMLRQRKEAREQSINVEEVSNYARGGQSA